MEKEFIQKKEPQKANFRFAFWGVFLVFFSVYFLLFTNSVSAATLTKAPNNLGLVGYWSFNEGAGTQAGDFSGNGNTGTISGATWTDGRFGKALNFDGTDDFVSLPSGCIVPASGSFTISGWVKPRAITGATRIFSQGVNSCTRRSALVFSSSKIQAFLTTSSDAVVPVAATDVLVTDEWQHFLWTFNGTTHTLYINGSVSDSIKSASVFGLEGDTYFGRRGTGNYLNGLLDDWRIYNRVLSASEISSLYNSGSVRRSTPTNLGLIAYWSFNEGTGTQAGDSSGNGNTGTISGATWTDGRFGKALDFDGVDDVVDVSSTDSLFSENQPITISAWIYPRSMGENNAGRIVDRSAGTNGPLFALTSTNTINFRVDGSTDLLRISSDNSIEIDSWQHVLVTWDGSTTAANISIYVNGVETSYKTTTNGVGIIDNIGDTFRIGNNSTGARTFDGLIDDVRVYNRAFSASEISALYQSSGGQFINSSQNDQLTEGLVGMWSFNGQDINWTSDTAGTAIDRGSGGNNGTLTNMNRRTSPVAGKVGQALFFDGSNSSVDFSNSAINNALNGGTGVSVSAWVKYDSIAQAIQDGNVIFSHVINSASNGSYFNIRGDVGNVGRVQFFARSVSSDTIQRRSSSLALTQGQWHHVVGVADIPNDKIMIYIDGELSGGEQSITFNNTTYTPGTPTQKGSIGEASANNDPFHGNIDEVRLYNRPLTASEVRQLYLMGK